MIELHEANFASHVTRYEYFWIEATDLCGLQGETSLDENSEEEIKKWMDDQMYMPWNFRALDP